MEWQAAAALVLKVLRLLTDIQLMAFVLSSVFAVRKGYQTGRRGDARLLGWTAVPMVILWADVSVTPWQWRNGLAITAMVLGAVAIGVVIGRISRRVSAPDDLRSKLPR